MDKAEIISLEDGKKANRKTDNRQNFYVMWTNSLCKEKFKEYVSDALKVGVLSAGKVMNLFK